MRFLYLGQTSMANRGCEALIRSTTALIRERIPEARFFCPSADRARDLAQWPTAEADGIDFVDVPGFSQRLKWWNRAKRVLPMVAGIDPPAYPLSGAFRQLIDQADAVLMTGGDIVSLDYGVFSLYHWTSMVDAGVRAGKPTHLLAASVGPFTRQPDVERRMVRHLKGYTSISVRETATEAYLRGLGIEGTALVADPAFTMVPAAWDDAAIFQPGTDYLGINFSPVVRSARGDEESAAAFDAEIVRFIASVIERTAMNVVLVSHVDPLGDSPINSDRLYMKGLLDRLPKTDRVSLLPKLLNTVQLKAAIGKCRYFIGARTHATVAALSQSVPTGSIAYSVKALGINRDLFGDTRYVLPTPDVSFDTLWAQLDLLIADETRIRGLLDARIPEWKQKARSAIGLLGGSA